MEKFRKALNIISVISSAIALIFAIGNLCEKTETVEESEE